jgi:hypothetical protein
MHSHPGSAPSSAHGAQMALAAVAVALLAALTYQAFRVLS